MRKLLFTLLTLAATQVHATEVYRPKHDGVVGCDSAGQTLSAYGNQKGWFKAGEAIVVAEQSGQHCIALPNNAEYTWHNDGSVMGIHRYCVVAKTDSIKGHACFWVRHQEMEEAR